MQATIDPGEDFKIVWKPLPGSQTLALSCPAQIILFHGTRGPGKTDSQLMRFRMRVGQGFGMHWRGVIFDREYKNLDDLIAKSMRWFPEFKDGCKFLSAKSDYRWVWPTGEQLLFRSIKKLQDYWAYHGQEFPFIGWNELTKYPDAELFEAMMSCNRSSYRPQDFPIIDEDTGVISYTDKLPLEVFATTNPFGVGHNWVKKRFINASPAGRIKRESIKVFNPQTQQKEDVVKTQVHLFGSYKENIYLDPSYIADLHRISDKNKKAAWLSGSWDIVAGGMFDDLWDTDYHVIKPFDIPHNWYLTKSFDWGSSRPFSVGWWAVSDGSDVYLDDGRTMSTVRGDAFRINEWYGCTDKPNQGLGLLNTQIAEGIVARELKMGIYQRIQAGPADGSIFDIINGNSISMDMAKDVRVNAKPYRGVTWHRADKSAGSRIHGWQKLRAMLGNSIPEDGKPRERPGLFVFDNCEHFVDLFPSAARDEKNMDDIDTESEDHICDETRYFALFLNNGVSGGLTVGGT